LRFGPAELSRSRLFSRLSLSLGASFDGRKLEVKVGIGQAKAGEGGPPGNAPVQQIRSSRDHDQAIPEFAFGNERKRQVMPEGTLSSRAEIPSDSSERDRPVSGSENSQVANFWDSLRPDQQRDFMSVASGRVFAAGARLMREGEPGDYVAVITSGLTEVRVRHDGAGRLLAERGPGQLIGERAALEINPRSATVVAVGTVEALVVRTADFARFLSAHPEVLRLVERQIFTRMLEDRPGSGRPELAGQNCTVVRTDVAGFSLAARSDEDRRFVRAELLTMTQQALGPLWQACWREDRGDGLLIVVPSSIPTAEVLERLTTALPPVLRAHNRIHREPVQIRLRVAMAVGPVEKDGPGVNGKAIIAASRLVEAPAFKRAAAAQGADFGIIVSPFVYQALVEPGGTLSGYAKVPVRVKETRESAWMRLTGTAQLGQVQLATSGASSPWARV